MDGSKTEPLGEPTTNDRVASSVEVTVPSEPLLLFRPETAEIIEVEPQDVPAWLQEIANLDKVVNDLQTARVNTEELTLKLQQQTDPARRASAEHKLKQAIKAEEQARETAAEATGRATEFNKNAAIWEVLPLASGSKLRGKKMTYVRSDKVKNHWRSYKLSAKDQPNLKSFLTRNDKGEWKLDEKKLKSAFLTVKPKLKTRAKDWKIWDKGVELVPEFAQAFNDAAKFGDPAQPEDMTEFSGGATLLRMFAGTSATAGVEAGSDSIADALSGKGKFQAAFKARGEAGVVLADAKADFKLWLPYHNGFHLYFPDGTPEGLNLGYYRATLTASVGASCGASLLAEGGAEISIGADGKQQLRGSSAGRTAKGLGRARLNVQSAKDAAGADLGAQFTAFAGVQAEAKLGGSFDWLRPETKDTWKEFAIIEPSIAGSAGAGATAAFNIRFEDGKFRIYAKLGACVGVGIKGGCEAVVDAGTIIEFVLWYKHQVGDSLDRNLRYFIAKPDFDRFFLIVALAMVQGKTPKDLFADLAFKSVDNIQIELFDYISTNPSGVMEQLGKASEWTLRSLAEAKANIWWWLNQTLEGSGETLDNVRESLLGLLSAIQTQQELENFYQFTSADIGVRNPYPAKVRQDIATIIGDSRLAMIETRLRREPAPGHRLAFNDTFQYRLQRGTHIAWDTRASNFSNYA